MNKIAVACVAVGLGVACGIQAATVSYSGSGVGPGSGIALSATATFELSGTDLKITLENTGDPAKSNPDILMALFWNNYGSGTLTPVLNSVAFPTGSSLYNGTGGLLTADQQDFNKHWAYKTGLTLPGSANSGISAAGFSGSGSFGPSGNFSASGINLDGLDYGIVNDLAAGNTINPASKKIFADSALEFRFTVSQDFSLSDILNVSFQYGTAIFDDDEPNIPSDSPRIPVPDAGATASLLGAGLIGLSLLRRKASR